MPDDFKDIQVYIYAYVFYKSVKSVWSYMFYVNRG